MASEQPGASIAVARRADLMVGWVYIAAAVALFGLSVWASAALDLGPAWLSQAVVWGICLPVIVASVYFLIRRRSLRHRDPKEFIFLGLLPLGAATVVALVAFAIRPQASEVHHSPAQALIVVADVSDAILFPDGAGRRVGPDVFERNAVALAMWSICGHLDELARGSASRAGARPGFWEWLREHGRVLVNWEPAPPHTVRFERQVESRLYFMDGAELWCVGQGKRLADGLRDELAGAKDWKPRPLGIPIKLKSLLDSGGARTVAVLLATADFDFRKQRDAWLESSTSDAATVLCVLLPSLPRSWDMDFRGLGAKADLLRRIHCPGPNGEDIQRRADGFVVHLVDDRTARRGDDLCITLFGGLPSLSHVGALDWGAPSDLDDSRNKCFGREQVARVRQAVERGALEALSIPPPARGGQTASRVARDRDIGWIAAALGGFLLFAMRSLRLRAFALQVNVSAPSRGVRAVLVVQGVLGLAATAAAVYCLWPGAQWEQNGRPAMAVWSFVGVWVAIVLWPMLYRLHARRDRTAKELVLSLALALTAVAAHPTVGLLLGHRSFWPNGAALLLPVGAMLVLLFLPKSDPQDTLADQTWARPCRWGGMATAAAFWVAIVLTGFAAAPGGVRQQCVGLVLLLFAALLAIGVIERLCGTLVRLLLRT